MFTCLPPCHVKTLRRVSEGVHCGYFLTACLCTLGGY
nr:MAG TPA: hypothetical protein [Caudoviricetes sp.]